MFLRRVLVGAVAAVLSATLLAGPAAATDDEFGSLTCAVGKVVWITEQTGAGTTTVSWYGGNRKLLKQQWSTTKTRTRQRATWWKVTTTGQMDHQATGASCGL